MNRTPVRYKGYIIIYNGPKNYDVLMPDEGYKFVGNYISLGEAKRNIDIRSRIDNPVKLRKLPGRERYRVYEGGKIRAKSTTKKKAKAQVKFLRGLSHGMKPRRNPQYDVTIFEELPGIFGASFETNKGTKALYSAARNYNTYSMNTREANKLEKYLKSLGVKVRRKKFQETQRNPPHEIYQDVVEIVARKGPGHKCDAKCKRANHTYRHKFSQKHHVTIFGNSDGSLTIRSVLK